MGFGGSPSPPPIPVAPPAATPPTMADSTVAQSGQQQRSRAAAAQAMAAQADKPGGLQAPAVAKTTLLGGGQ